MSFCNKLMLRCLSHIVVVGSLVFVPISLRCNQSALYPSNCVIESGFLAVLRIQIQLQPVGLDVHAKVPNVRYAIAIYLLYVLSIGAFDFVVWSSNVKRSEKGSGKGVSAAL